MKAKKMSKKDEISQICFYDQGHYVFKVGEHLLAFSTIDEMKKHFSIMLDFINRIYEQRLQTDPDFQDVALNEAWANNPHCQQCSGHPSHWGEDCLGHCSNNCNNKDRCGAVEGL
jgi:hypothetical protein